MSGIRRLTGEDELRSQVERRRNVTPRQRGQLPGVFFAEREVSERLLDRGEIALPVSPLQARAEAVRCLECATSPCRTACPLGVDVPRFLLLAAEGDFRGAIQTIRQTSLLPAIAGRLCPHENYCQKDCTVSLLHKDLGYAVSVGRIEAFLGDWERLEGAEDAPGRLAPTGMQVAVVGAGPAGLAASAELRRLGHEVTVFEASNEAGGFLVHGIPEFRLPRDVVRREVEALVEAGVEFQFDTVIGKTMTVDELFAEGFDALFLAAGGGPPRLAGIPGETLNGVYSAIEYLTRVNSKNAASDAGGLPVLKRERVAVIGRGEMALDAARSAFRVGAGEVHVVVPVPDSEMGVPLESLRHAEEEGVQLHFRSVPREIVGTPDGWVRALAFEVSDPDGAGRSEILPVELVIEALGQKPNVTLADATPRLGRSAEGRISVTAETMMTTKRKVFAGGDMIAEGTTVLQAMADGRRAALSIDSHLRAEAGHS